MNKPFIYKEFGLYFFQAKERARRRNVMALVIKKLNGDRYTDDGYKEYRYVPSTKEATIRSAKSYIDKLECIRIKGLRKEKYQDIITVPELRGWKAIGTRSRQSDRFVIRNEKKQLMGSVGGGGMLILYHPEEDGQEFSPCDYKKSIRNAIRFTFLKTQKPNYRQLSAFR